MLYRGKNGHYVLVDAKITVLLISLQEMKHRIRIIEWLGLEGSLTILCRQFQAPCHGQGHLALDQVAQSPIQPGLEHFQGGGIHNFSGQRAPGLHHPHTAELLSYI